jgi:ribosome recycling factor
MPRQSGESEFTDTDVLSDADDRMGKAIDALKRTLATIRTGRASPSLVENVQVEYYGTPTPMNQLATIAIPEARLILIQPWDKKALSDIEKALLASDLGLNPSNDGTVIRLPIPPLSEERRRDLVRTLGQRIENGKVSVRNVRRSAMEQLRNLEKAKEMSQDEARRAQDDLQQLTDAHIDAIDDIAKAKEAEIMQV